MHKVQILDHAYLILQSKYWGGVQLCIRDYTLFPRIGKLISDINTYSKMEWEYSSHSIMIDT